MSEVKELLLEGIIIEKVEEMIKDLKTEILKEKHEENQTGNRLGKSYPYECLLGEIEPILIKYQKWYVSTSYSLDVYDVETCSMKEYIKESYPTWEHIYDEKMEWVT